MSANLSPELQAITWQLAAAFGQGAGTMILSAPAAQAVMAFYGERFGKMEPSEINVLKMIEFMRAIGAASAMYSLQDGGAIIDTDAVKKAIAALKAKQKFPLGDCPICTDIIKPPLEDLKKHR
jgi:hypothetical protein